MVMPNEAWLDATDGQLGLMLILGPGDRAVQIVVMMRDNATGVVRSFSDNVVLPDGHSEPVEFIWSEGNCSCDCNRSLLFAKASGMAPENIKSAPCGDSRYSLNLVNPASGRVFYREFEG